MRRGVANSPAIGFAFATVHAAQPVRGRTPLLFQMGGVGASVRLMARQPDLIRAMSQDRDLILTDHRGSGESLPLFDCPGFANVSTIWSAPLAKQRACAQSFVARGIDKNKFGPVEAAQDIRDLRRALGIKSWDVYAVSYGTTIVHRLIAIDEAAIGRVVLDGVSAADNNSFAPSLAEDTFADMLDSCAADRQCKAAFPSLEPELALTLAHLPTHGGNDKAPDRRQFMARLWAGLYDLTARRALPDAIHRAAFGDFSAWAMLKDTTDDPGDRRLEPALTWNSSVCRSEYAYRNDTSRRPPPRRMMPAVIRANLHVPDFDKLAAFCAPFAFAREPWANLASVRSALPILVLDGQVDMNTPLAFSRQARAYLPNARAIEFPATAHWVLRQQTACALPIVQAFLAGGPAFPDTACVAALPAIDWITR